MSEDIQARAQRWLDDYDGFRYPEGADMLIRDLLAAVEARQWQPIATAPKDGTRVLLSPARWTAEGTVSGYYAAGLWLIESGDVNGHIRAFTDPDEDARHWPFLHWMPLPAPPEAAR